MKRIIIALLVIVIGVQGFGQSILVGQVKGRVFDGNAGQPFENVTIAVYSMPDSSTVKGAATDMNGEFVIEDLPEETIFCLLHL